MDNSWVKLYRKIAENEVLFDDKALRVFVWLLTKVDKRTGTLKIGRIWSSQAVRLKPSTFYDVLTRLEKKYKIATCKSNSKFTEISLLNWAKYNKYQEKPTGMSNNKPAALQQQTDTLQEYKNKEYKTNDKSLQYGNPEINNLISYMKETLGLPMLDGSEKQNRQFAHLSLKKYGGLQKVKLLIDAAAHSPFWSTKVTSFQRLYYKGVEIISSARGEVKSLDATKILHSETGSGRNLTHGKGISSTEVSLITGAKPSLV